MSSLHTIVDSYVLKPASKSTGIIINNKSNNVNQSEEEDDVDILDEDDDEEEDEDDDLLEDDEEGDNDDEFINNNNNNNSTKTKNNNNNHTVQSSIPLPNLPNNNNKTNNKTNNYLSINHIISPNNSQSPSNNTRETHNHSSSSSSPSLSPSPSSSIPRQETRPDPQATPVIGQKEQIIIDDSLDLLRENRHLRKKVEGLMAHNMQLMLGVKERDHKIFRQKRLLVKYRKALLRFFEENESSSSDEELSPSEFKSAMKKDAKLDLHLRNMEKTPQSNVTASPITPSHPPPSIPISLTSPPSISLTSPPSFPTNNNNNINNNNNNNNLSTSITPLSSRVSQSPPSSPPSPSFIDAEDKDDESDAGDFDFEVAPRKRKGIMADLDLMLEPDKKKRGPRRNALWTPEDDELFQKIYSVYGKSWKTIHNYMPGKTREQVQSHGQYLIRIGKLEDIKGGPQRGRKVAKKEKEREKPISGHHRSHSSSSSSSHQLSHQYPPMPQIMHGFDDSPL